MSVASCQNEISQVAAIGLVHSAMWARFGPCLGCALKYNRIISWPATDDIPKLDSILRSQYPCYVIVDYVNMIDLNLDYGRGLIKPDRSAAIQSIDVVELIK